MTTEKSRWRRDFFGVEAGDKRVESPAGDVDHKLMLWIRPSIVLRSLGSSCRRVWILSTACRTVVWSFPPKARPISERDEWVIWRARYMGTCRGKAMALVRVLA